ncbi:MAG TPA: PQQ-binding-like beta-propeller repeat protein [Pirellulaceae bacterium]|nr:PQQ-binding-like beta-propeller repeat protein [Pirellulaceae bacterium]
MRYSLPCLMVGVCLLLAMPALGEDWPQWRGPNRDDVSQEKGLLQEWPEGGPQRLWLSSDAGLGYSGFSVVGDTLYTMGARGEEEFLIAVNASNGTEKWSIPVGLLYKESHGNGPRGTPTVDGDRVYALSGNGTLACAKGADGSIVWKVEMAALGGRRPNWGYCESPLVDGEKVVCTPGGEQGAVVALNKMNGELIWQSKDFTAGAQYSSIIIAEHNGRRQYVALTQKKFAGIDAASGDVLWASDWHGQTAVVSTPIFHDGHVYISSGYGSGGSKLVELEADGSATDVYDNKVMVNHHGGVVRIGDHLYGYSDGKGWVCQDFKSGEMVWNERAKLGKGCLTYADGRLYLMDERGGNVALIEASPNGYHEHGRFTLDPQSRQRTGGRVWTHPVVANGKLFLRDQELLFCFDIRRELTGGR